MAARVVCSFPIRLDSEISIVTRSASTPAFASAEAMCGARRASASSTGP